MEQGYGGRKKNVVPITLQFSFRDSLELFALLSLHVPTSKQTDALKANWLEMVALCPTSHQTWQCSELPGSVYTCACFKVGSAHRVPTKLRNSKCLLQFYKDFLIAFSFVLPFLLSFHFMLLFLPHPPSSRS